MTKEEIIQGLYRGDSRVIKEAIKALEQQPSDDCVSRKALIERINNAEDNFISDHQEEMNDGDSFCDGIMSAIFNIREMVAQAPSVTPTQNWIPVSERLPKEFEFVNCTCHSLIDDREDWVVETVYTPQPSDSPYSDWGNIPMLNSGDCEVVAWVHRDIPKPYKTEMESE